MIVDWFCIGFQQITGSSLKENDKCYTVCDVNGCQCRTNRSMYGIDHVIVSLTATNQSLLCLCGNFQVSQYPTIQLEFKFNLLKRPTLSLNNWVFPFLFGTLLVPMKYAESFSAIKQRWHSYSMMNQAYLFSSIGFTFSTAQNWFSATRSLKYMDWWDGYVY